MPCNICSCVCGNCMLPQRILVAIMSFFGIIVCYGQRVALNIAITEMVIPKKTNSTSCPYPNKTGGGKKIAGAKLPWTEMDQNLILAAFYVGYFIMQVPAGMFSDKLGGRYIYSTGVLISTLVTCCTPLAIINAPWWLIASLRILMGMGQSTIYPCISTLYARWIPPSERSLLGAFSFSANAMGVICGSFVTGMVIRALGQWEPAFYVWTAFGGLWYFMFMIFVFSSPDESPHITEKEFEMLKQTVVVHSKTLKIPWLGFCKDMSIWALVIGEIGHDYTIFTLITNMPKYMHDVLHYEIRENAVACSIPYLCQWLSGLLCGRIVDFLIVKKNVPTLRLRNIVTTIGLTTPCIFIVIAGYMGCNGNMVVVMFSINLLTKGAFYCGLKINHLDISVNFPGIIMAVTNGAGSISGFVSPYVIAIVAPDNTLEQWHKIYWIVFLMGLSTNIFYCIFSKAERASWDMGPDEIDEYLRKKAEKKAKKAELKEAKRKAKEEKKNKG